MKALVIHKAHDLRVEDRDAPGAPGPGEVRVTIERGGICGSDMHYFEEGGIGDAIRVRQPMALGHEASGRITALGAGVEGLSVGDLVAVNPSNPCGECHFCRQGLHNQCLDMRFSGSAMRMPHEQGLFQRDVVVPAGRAVKLSQGIDPGLAALCEPFAVCLAAVRKASNLVGRDVLVSGCGPIGCLTVAAAKLAGARRIHATDLSPEPLEIARKLGATDLIDLKRDGAALDPLRERKGMIDTVFECSGAGPALRTACEVLRPRGELVIVGMGADPALPQGKVVAKELTLVGTFRFDTEFELAARLIDAGAVDLAPVISHTFALPEAEAAFRQAGDRKSAMKVQLDFADA